VKHRFWPALDVRLTAASASERRQLEEQLSAALDDFAPSAIQELDDRWLVFFGSSDDRDRAAEALSAAAHDRFVAEPLDVADEDWARRSQQELGAVEVGRVVIAPPWAVPDRSAPSPDRVTVVIQPSMGFGTGHHATTRLCTALLQRLDLSDRTVLDVGTGSGVLALTALALGARSVLAVDDDADAIESARENLALNGGAIGIELRVGDFRGLPPNRFDVVVANLTGGLLARSADVLAGAVATGGSLVISGVTLEEEAEVLRAFAPWMAVVERLTEDEWVAARLRHHGPRLSALGSGLLASRDLQIAPHTK
jgi:ribosomal protein L11 methyltransferase